MYENSVGVYECVFHTRVCVCRRMVGWCVGVYMLLTALVSACSMVGEDAADDDTDVDIETQPATPNNAIAYSSTDAET